MTDAPAMKIRRMTGADFPNDSNTRRHTVFDAPDAPAADVKQAQHADYMERMIAHIKSCGLGFIDNQPQSIALCLYELEEKIVIDDSFGDFKERAIQARDEAVARLSGFLASKAEDAPAAEVLVLENLNPVVVYSGGIDPVIERITREAKAQPVDISTAAGRKDCASLAYKIARSKTYLDDMGKKLGEDARKQIDAINADRKKVTTALDALKNEIRKPLDDWEQQERDRVLAHEIALAGIGEAATITAQQWQSIDPQAMRERLASVAQCAGRDWQEFTARAKVAIQTASDQISASIAQRLQHDADQSELARLKAEQAAREQAERDAKIAAEAAAKAKADAERIAKEAADKAAAEAQAAAEKAEQDRLAIQREKEAAEKRERDAIEAAERAEAQRIADAKQAEIDRLAAEQKAKDDAEAARVKVEREAAELAAKVEADRIAAEKKAKADADAAVEAERKRLADIAAAEAAETAKREANTKHRAKINNEALAGLVAAGLSETDAKAAVTAIAKGDVAHVSISY